MSTCILCDKPATREVRLVTVDRDGKNSQLSLQFTCDTDARTILKKACEDRERRIERFTAIKVFD